MSVATTIAPASLSAAHTARPMPPAAPVTSAIVSFSSIDMTVPSTRRPAAIDDELGTGAVAAVIAGEKVGGTRYFRRLCQAPVGSGRGDLINQVLRAPAHAPCRPFAHANLQQRRVDETRVNGVDPDG